MFIQEPKELDEIEKTKKVFIEIGKITMLYKQKIDMKFSYKNKLKTFDKNIEEATKLDRSFGMYEDCGSFYEEMVVRANSIKEGFSYLRDEIVRVEKYQKLLMHRFEEKYPEYVDILNKELQEEKKIAITYLQEKRDRILEEKAQKEKSKNTLRMK